MQVKILIRHFFVTTPCCGLMFPARAPERGVFPGLRHDSVADVRPRVQGGCQHARGCRLRASRSRKRPLDHREMTGPGGDRMGAMGQIM
jgi:hypothetical protein